jgi:hypothetical protein
VQSVTVRPGMTVGSYDLRRSIGTGGSAVVYEAVHRSLGRRVALKILDARPSDPAHAERVHSRFLREARVAARAHHAHLLEIFEFGEADGVSFLAMELVEGGTLAQLLRREGKLPLSRAVEILLPILAATAKLHSVGIVHRDIKPSNILLSGSPDLCPKLADFGVSRLDDGSASITQSESMLGTPAYMPPELVLFTARAATELSDQYSLAITLYECVTGTKPFRGATAYEIMHSVVSAAAPPPSSREPRLPKAFDEVVLRAMHRDPDARFASVGELAGALLAFASTDVAMRWRQQFGPLSTEVSPDEEEETRGRARAEWAMLDSPLAGPPPVRILHCDDGLGVAEVANVCVVIWRKAVVRCQFERQRKALAEVVIRHPDGAAFICVIEGTVTPPDDELRKASSEMLASHGAQLKCLACVIEAQGFLAAIHRGVTTAMLLLLRPRSGLPVSFFSSVDGAIRWTRSQLPTVPSDVLASGVEHLRSRLPGSDVRRDAELY